MWRLVRGTAEVGAFYTLWLSVWTTIEAAGAAGTLVECLAIKLSGEGGGYIAIRTKRKEREKILVLVKVAFYMVLCEVLPS